MVTPQVQLKKLQYLYYNDRDFQIFTEQIQRAHYIMLELILASEKFSTMENNPLHSKDATFGIPKRYYDILEEIQAEDEAIEEKLPKIELKMNKIRAGLGFQSLRSLNHVKKLSSTQHHEGKYNRFNDRIFNFEEEDDEYDEEEYYDECQLV